MIPVRVALEGFLSYRERQTLNFEGCSLWVLAGPNGAGKSAIFDAITFALFGAHRLGKQRVDELINHYCDGLEVEFDFLVDGTLYRIRRTARRNARGVTVQQREAFRLVTNGGRDLSVVPVPRTEGDAFSKWVEQTVGLDYEAFTSSVLLLQGQSEKLLNAAGKKDACEILKQLIDLLPYEQLYALADSRRRQWDGQRKALTTTRDAIASVSDEDLAAGLRELQLTEASWKAALADVERLTALAQQAKHWEQLTGDLQTVGREVQKAQELLSRGEEILRSFARLEELEKKLPALEAIVAGRKRLHEQQAAIGELEQQLPGLEQALREVEARQKTATENVERIAIGITDAQAKSTEVAGRLAAIAPLVARLEQWESIRDDLTNAGEQLRELPRDLTEQLEVARQRERELMEAERALPWLRTLAAAREGLAGSLGRQEQASDCLQKTETALQRLKHESRERSTRVEEAGAEVRKLELAVDRARERQDQARDHLQQFLGAAEERVCSLCGQPIDKKHAATERGRLETAVASAATQVERTEADLTDMWEKVKGEQTAVAELGHRAVSLDEQRQDEQKERDRAGQEARHHRAQITSAYGNLSPGYQARIVTAAPQDDASWLATTFPSEDDLLSAAAEAGAQTQHHQHLTTLEQEHRKRERLNDRRQDLEQNRQELEQSLDVELGRAARVENLDLKRAQQVLQDDLGSLMKEQKQVKKALEEEAGALDTALQQRHQREQKLTIARATRDEIRLGLTAQVQSLDEGWRDLATAADAARIQELHTEKGTLRTARDEKRSLDSARDRLADLEERIAGLRDNISSLPDPARRPSVEVHAELALARTARDGTDECRRQADRSYKELQDRKQRRKAADAELRAADRQHHLHSRLSRLLGREGLQLALLRQGERAIVELANETLEGLSRGRLRLELRSGGAADAALDLVAYNLDTSPKAVAVGLSSGSQRFRIAVSLALAIGRYTGLESRRIESVIIDEGFGSLDKNSRDDMIQELHGLKQQLQRIILVSHQEEFTGGFTHGYDISLCDGASRVNLMQ